MKLTYIFHSGFVLETETCFAVFDYWKDFADVKQQFLLSAKPLYVFCTHAHPDHFNPEILAWRQQKNNIKYIFSNDILKSRRAAAEDAVFLRRYESFEDDLLRIFTFGSTDIGVSFVVEIGGKIIFHAGDLNNWHWCNESTEQEIRKAEGDYLHVIKVLRQSYAAFDLAMFPVDARIGGDYWRGAEQFVKKFAVANFAPMHFGDNYDSINIFKPIAEANGCKFLQIKKPGNVFDIA